MVIIKGSEGQDTGQSSTPTLHIHAHADQLLQLSLSEIHGEPGHVRGEIRLKGLRVSGGEGGEGEGG